MATVDCFYASKIQRQRELMEIWKNVIPSSSQENISPNAMPNSSNMVCYNFSNGVACGMRTLDKSPTSFFFPEESSATTDSADSNGNNSSSEQLYNSWTRISSAQSSGNFVIGENYCPSLELRQQQQNSANSQNHKNVCAQPSYSEITAEKAANFQSCWSPISNDENTPLFSSWSNVYNWINSNQTGRASSSNDDRADSVDSPPPAPQQTNRPNSPFHKSCVNNNVNNNAAMSNGLGKELWDVKEFASIFPRTSSLEHPDNCHQNAAHCHVAPTAQQEPNANSSQDEWEQLEYSNILQELLKFDPFSFGGAPKTNSNQSCIKSNPINEKGLTEECDILGYFKNVDTIISSQNSFEEDLRAQISPKMSKCSYTTSLIDVQYQPNQIYNSNNSSAEVKISNSAPALCNRSDSGYISPKDWMTTSNNTTTCGQQQRQSINNHFNYAANNNCVYPQQQHRAAFWTGSQSSSSHSSINSQNQQQQQCSSEEERFNAQTMASKFRPIVGRQQSTPTQQQLQQQQGNKENITPPIDFLSRNRSPKSNICDEAELKWYHRNLELQQSIYEHVYNMFMAKQQQPPLTAVLGNNQAPSHPLLTTSASIPTQMSLSNGAHQPSTVANPVTSMANSLMIPARRTSTSLELHARLEECLDQYRQLEKERKKTEAELARQNLGKHISSANRFPIPRLPAAPSRIDRLVVDFFREHARVVTLLEKMEELRAKPLDDEIHRIMRQFLDTIRLLQQCRLNERNAILKQLKGEIGTYNEEKENANLITALCAVNKAVLKVRSANWCSLMWTIDSAKCGKAVANERQAQICAILEANYELAPPEIKLSAL